MLADPEAVARHYVRALQGRNWEDAYHSLLEMGDQAIFVLGDELRKQPDASVRQILARLLGQSRSDQAVPLLEEVLEGTAPPLWKEALDALVTIGSPTALNCLLQVRQRADVYKKSCLDEAIGQVRDRISDNGDQ
jgi:HEAT repeat protein